jgi:hypothetical protein
MSAKYTRLFGSCLLGGGVALAFGAINQLHRMSETAAKYREVLAPHLANVPLAAAYSGSAEDLKWKFSVRTQTSETFQLKALDLIGSRSDPSTARVLAIGGLVMMGIGAGLLSNSTCTSAKNSDAEQAVSGNRR